MPFEEMDFPPEIAVYINDNKNNEDIPRLMPAPLGPLWIIMDHLTTYVDTWGLARLIDVM